MRKSARRRVYNRHAVMYVIEKALQSTCLNMNWCEVPLSSKSTIFAQYNKRSEKCFSEVNENFLNISSVSTTKRISKLKGRIQ